MRVERPLDLASLVFETTADWGADRTRQAIEYQPDVYGRDEDLKGQFFAG